MKKLKIEKRGLALALAGSFAMAFLLSGCGLLPDQPQPPKPPAGTGGTGETAAIGADDFLRAQGEDVVNKKREKVYLRGVNAGGLFVIEQWMNGFTHSYTNEIPIDARDFRTTTLVFLERFGEEKTKELWETYQANWWQDVDFETCHDMGMNVIRLPFTYMTVDFGATKSLDGAGHYDFSMLDAFVEKAASYGMYTMLDLHGAYGSQNGQDHSGETIDSALQVDFYTNPRKQGLTADLWRALAEHYKDNPAVAGYDILNEPGEKAQSTNETHFAVFDLIYDAIREKDKDHMVIFESCWEGENLPHPEEYGWENCMYSFHHYSNCASGNQYLQHASSWNDKISNVSRQHFGVPLHMGEFNCYNDAEQWEYSLSLLNEANWHWTSWTYKINNTWANSAWGIVSVPAEEKVNAHTDSFEAIKEKFSHLATSENVHRTDLGGITLEEIMKAACTAPVQEKLKDGEYYFFDSLSALPLMETEGKIVLSEDRNSGTRLTVWAHADGDGSVYLTTGGRYLTVDGNNTLIVTSTPSGGASRFFPVQTEYGYAFRSYSVCRYLALQADGTLRAGSDLGSAAIFECGDY